MRCDQRDCRDDACCCFAWPGRELLGACLAHGTKAAGVAAALGFALDLRPVAALEEVRAAAVLRRLTGVEGPC